MTTDEERPRDDLASPVVALVGEGMKLETDGDQAGASAKYAEAWDAATNDYERCVAAHYVPRHINDAQEKLRWNRDALRYADAVGDDRVAGFYASLHACVGFCHLLLGDRQGALAAYEQAEAALPSVMPGPYKDQVATSIADALASLRVPVSGAGSLGEEPSGS